MRAELAGLNHELKGDFTQDNFLMETMTSITSLDLIEGGVKYFKHVNTEIKADLEMDMKVLKVQEYLNQIITLSLNEVK